MFQEIFHIPLPHFLQDWFGKPYLPVYGYGLMLVIGFMLGAQLAKFLARRCGYNGDAFINACLLALVTGVVGPGLLWRAAYLGLLGLIGLLASGRRLARLLLV